MGYEIGIGGKVLRVATLAELQAAVARGCCPHGWALRFFCEECGVSRIAEAATAAVADANVLEESRRV